MITPHLIERAVRLALEEDLGLAGDLSALAIPPDQTSQARFLVKATGVVAGLEVARVAFALTDPTVQFESHFSDGDRAKPGDVVASVSGKTRSLLTAERTALNFLGHLSGIATATRTLVDLIHGTKAKIVDTRKTTPGLRALEKYAVRCGGGFNHRMGLFDAVMLKDNHLAASPSITEAVSRVRAPLGHLVPIEIEIARLEDLEEAVATRANVVMLDNMSPEQVREAVTQTEGRVVLEASGNLNASTIRAYAETGVDVLSVGAITHSAPNLDISLEFSP